MSTTTSPPVTDTATASVITVSQTSNSTTGKKVRYEIHASGAVGGGDAPLARAYVRLPPDPRPAQRVRRPPVDVFEGAEGPLLCALQPLRADGAGEQADHPSGAGDEEGDGFEVRASDGTPLARIERRPGRVLPWPRRVRWQVRPVAPRPAGADGADGASRGNRGPWLTGKVGAWYTWACYAVTAPVLWLLSAAVSLAQDGDPPTWLRGPRRVRWRDAGTAVPLERRGRGGRRGRDGTEYRLDRRRLDPRIAYAQTVLVEWGHHCPR